MSTATDTRAVASAPSLVSSAAFRTFVIVFAIAAPIIYMVCEMRNWPLFTYHPATDRLDLFYAASRKDEGPAMHWYGWTANTLIGGPSSDACHDVAGKRHQKDSFVAHLDRAAHLRADPDLWAEILLALGVGTDESLIGRITLAICAAVAFGAQGFAGGDDYDASNDVEGAGPAYFGFVRDHRGSPVSDAQVILRPKMGRRGDDQDQRARALSQSYQQGCRADDVQITCEKSGYRQTRCSAARRPAPRTCSSKPNAPCSGYRSARIWGHGSRRVLADRSSP